MPALWDRLTESAPVKAVEIVRSAYHILRHIILRRGFSSFAGSPGRNDSVFLPAGHHAGACLFFFFKGTDIGEMVAALEHAHIPKAITISIAVMLRFVPSIREDYRYIKQGMKTRGIKLGPVQVVTHPGSTYEALIVPLMMRVVRTSSELAASAETRGILYDGPKTYLNPVKMRVLDYIAFAFLRRFISAQQSSQFHRIWRLKHEHEI